MPCAPLEVRIDVVVFVSIYVVDFREIERIAHERFGDDSVNFLLLALAILIKSNKAITVFVVPWLYQLAF